MLFGLFAQHKGAFKIFFEKLQCSSFLDAYLNSFAYSHSWFYAIAVNIDYGYFRLKVWLPFLTQLYTYYKEGASTQDFAWKSTNFMESSYPYSK